MNNEPTRQELKVAIDKNTEGLAEIREAVVVNTEAIAEIREAVVGNTEAIAELREAVAGNRQAIAENRQAIADNREAIADNRNAIAENRQAIAENREAILKNGEAIADNRAAIGRLEVKFDRQSDTLSTLFEVINDHFETMYKKFDDFSAWAEESKREHKLLFEGQNENRYRLDEHEKRLKTLESRAS